MMRPQMMWPHWARALLLGLFAAGAAHAGPLPFDLGLSVPPVIVDSEAPAGCTVTYLIADTVTNDVFAARMRIESAETDSPVNRRLPCPRSIPPRMGVSALGVCTSRTELAKSCVFADMSRGFEAEPEVRNTAENGARCASDQASDIGIACWSAGTLHVCNVGCGNGAAQAMQEAKARCEEKHQRGCPIIGSVPVSGP